MWQRTEQFRKVVFLQIETSRPKDLETSQFWPEDVRWVRDGFVRDWQKWTANDRPAVPRQAEAAISMSPRFFVGQDGTLLASAAGKAGWLRHIQPLLDRLLGEA